MKILYLLIPLGFVVMGVALWAIIWAVKNGQFEDLEGPAHRILMDDDDPLEPGYQSKAKDTTDSDDNLKSSSQ